MAALQALYLQPLLIFVLVLTRVSGLLMTAPILGTRDVPMQVRALLAIGISLLVTPLYLSASVQVGSLVDLMILMAQEAALGLALGLSVTILFAGLQLGGQVIGQMSGLSLADVFDPTFDATVPVFSQLLQLTTLAIFVILGGHRELMRTLLDGFSWMPPGQGRLPEGLIDALVAILSQSFMLGLQASAPVMVALLLAVILLGLISRTLPQLNVLVVGLSLNSIVMLATLCFTFGTLVWVFQAHVIQTLETIHDALGGPGG